MLRPSARSSPHASQVSKRVWSAERPSCAPSRDPASHDEPLWARQAPGAWFAAKGVQFLGSSLPLFSGIDAAEGRRGNNLQTLLATLYLRDTSDGSTVCSVENRPDVGRFTTLLETTPYVYVYERRVKPLISHNLLYT